MNRFSITNQSEVYIEFDGKKYFLNDYVKLYRRNFDISEFRLFINNVYQGPLTNYALNGTPFRQIPFGTTLTYPLWITEFCNRQVVNTIKVTSVAMFKPKNENGIFTLSQLLLINYLLQGEIVVHYENYQTIFNYEDIHINGMPLYTYMLDELYEIERKGEYTISNYNLIDPPKQEEPFKIYTNSTILGSKLVITSEGTEITVDEIKTLIKLKLISGIILQENVDSTKVCELINKTATTIIEFPTQ